MASMMTAVARKCRRRPVPAAILAVAAAVGFRAPAGAQIPFQVRDVGQGPAGHVSETLAVGPTVYFVAARPADPDPGATELWRSDGTTAGTMMLKAFPPSHLRHPFLLTPGNGIVFFVGYDPATGYELWKTDGTPGGTVLIKDIEPGPEDSIGFSSIPPVSLDGTTLIFEACTTVAGCEPWRSDGSLAGTTLLKDVNPGAAGSTIQQFVKAGARVYFDVYPALWSTDGTTVGTVSVHPTINPRYLTEFNGSLFFLGADGPGTFGLWMATTAGTTFLHAFDFIYGMAKVGGMLFLDAVDSATGEELWKTNGTAAGTLLVKDVAPGPVSSLSHPTVITDVNGTAFFFANATISTVELWKSNGSAGGTVLLKTFDEQTNRNLTPTSVAAVNGTFYFAADDGTGAGLELWKSGGSAAGTVLVKDILPGAGWSQPRQMVVANGVLYFAAADGVTGFELWRSNGTSTGTVLVKDAITGTEDGFPSRLTGSGGRVFFSAFDTSSGRELWRTDGTPYGTAMVTDLEPGAQGSEPEELTDVNGTLFFTACTSAYGREVWQNDAALGPQIVANINTGTPTCYDAYANPAELTAVGSRLYFRANDGVSGLQLWKSDGYASGANVLTAPPTGGVLGLTAMGGLVYFTASNPTTGSELWSSNGTTTAPLDVVPGSGGIAPQHLTNVGGTLYFAATDAMGTELWKSNGTVAGTMRVADIVAGAGSSSPFALSNIGGTLYFFANDTFTTVELWKSNGTAGTTSLVRQLERDPSLPTYLPLTAVGTIGFFDGYDSTAGHELWKTDGTFAGTSRVKDINPGAGHAYPYDLVNVGGTLYFSADDGTPGGDLWTSNGTAPGTVRVKDFAGFSYDDRPWGLTNVNGILYFSALDGPQGSELWALCPGPGDHDGDGIADVFDNCCTAYNPDQRNSDLSGLGDLCDVCPAGATDACGASQSAAGIMPPSGPLVLQTADQSVSVTVPAGAASAGTTVSITGGLASSSYGLGTSSTAQTIDLEPGLVCVGGTSPGRACFTTADCSGSGASCQDYVFNLPVTVTFRWQDTEMPGSQGSCPPGTPGNGRVDVSNIDERNLKIFRNGLNFYPSAGTTCADVPADCSRCTNVWTITTAQFSEWSLARECDAMTSAQLKVAKVAEPVGDDILSFKGTFLNPGAAPVASFDPSIYGIDIILDDATGTVLPTAIPASTYDPVTKTGWKAKYNPAGATFIYLNKTAGAPGAIQKVALKVPDTFTLPSKLLVKAKGGAFPLSSSPRVSVAFPGLSDWFQGESCVEARFAGPPPAPTCTVTGGGTLVCK
jgi:ELWxxDGT repeat protein